MGKGQGLTAGIEHPSVRILRPFLWLFPSDGYTLGRNPQGIATSWTFPSVPIVATVSSSAHKRSLLKSVPHQCPVSRWRTGQPTTSERQSLFLRTAHCIISGPRYTGCMLSLCSITILLFLPHAVYSSGLEREGREEEEEIPRLLRESTSLCLSPHLVFTEPWRYTVSWGGTLKNTHSGHKSQRSYTASVNSAYWR